MTSIRKNWLGLLLTFVLVLGVASATYAKDPNSTYNPVDYGWVPSDGLEEFDHTDIGTHLLVGFVLWDSSDHLQEYSNSKLNDSGYEHEALYFDRDGDGEHWMPENEDRISQNEDLVAWYSELPENDYFDEAVEASFTGVADWTIGTWEPQNIPINQYLEVTVETEIPQHDNYGWFKRGAAIMDNDYNNDLANCPQDDEDCMVQHDSAATVSHENYLDGDVLSWECTPPAGVTAPSGYCTQSILDTTDYDK